MIAEKSGRTEYALFRAGPLLCPFRHMPSTPERVASVERKRWGDLVLHLATGAKLPVGKTWRDAARRLTAGGLPLA